MTNIIPLNTDRWLSWQVYHSSFVDDEGITKACGCPLLPLKSHIKGPAPVSNQGYSYVTYGLQIF